MHKRFNRTLLGLMMCVGLSLDATGCKDLAGTQPLPAGTVSPGVLQSVRGAATLAHTAQVAFQTAFAVYIPISGLVTDELQSGSQDAALNNLGNVNNATIIMDARLLDQAADWAPNARFLSDKAYIALQYFRGMAGEAIGDLAAYAPDTLKATRGLLYALQGYAEVMLADLFCSGVPLSTLDYNGNYTYQPGSTTQQIYQHAVALFDTALVLAVDSAPILNLARVGQGRAYLALGEYAAAEHAVSDVPMTFQMIDSIVTCGQMKYACPSLAAVTGATGVTYPAQYAIFSDSANYGVSDREAGTGLPFVSSGDPRTADTTLGTSVGGTFSLYFPKKYNVAGVSAIVLASGIEAQLITAEADINTGYAASAFTILNALRKHNSATMGLATLTDPGTRSAEIDTLFTERAAWLFVDGHRQGDLRRLTRDYVNGQGLALVANQYPNGNYPEVGVYGTFIDAPIPAAELANPQFTGCLSRD